MDKISIIIPVFNAEKYIRETVASIVNQTYSNLEIILVNDGSTDSSYEVCEQIKATDSRIILINKENGGVSSARNAGLEVASGEYITFVDADDLLEADMYETLHNEAVYEDADIVSCAARVIQNGLTIREEYGTNKKYVMKKDEALMNFFKQRIINIGIWCKLFRKHVITGLIFENGKSMNEDKYFIFEALMKARTVVIVDIIKYNYIKRESSITSGGFTKKWLDNVYFSEKMLSVIKNECPELFQCALLNDVLTKYWVAYLIIKSKNKKDEYRQEYKKIVEDIRSEYIKIRDKRCISKMRRINIALLIFAQPLFEIINSRKH